MSRWPRLRTLEWREFADWPLPWRGAACVLLAVLAFALPWGILTRSDAARASALAARADGLQAQLAGHQLHAADALPTSAPIPSTLPDGASAGIDLPQQVAGMAQMAQARGLHGAQFRPGREETRIGPYRGIPVAVRLAGSWSQLSAFIADLAAPVHGALFSLHDVAVRASPAATPEAGQPAAQAGPSLELRATVRIWPPDPGAAAGLPPDRSAASDDPPAAGTAAFPRNPFAPLRAEPSARSRQALEQVPLAALTLLGTLDTVQGRTGLLLAPDGQLHRVRTGSWIGQQQGQVQAIERTQMTVIEQIPDGTGGWHARPVVIGLNTDR